MVRFNSVITTITFEYIHSKMNYEMYVWGEQSKTVQKIKTNEKEIKKLCIIHSNNNNNNGSFVQTVFYLTTPPSLLFKQ